MSTQVYLIRHGETMWNKKKIVQGHMNSELSSKGKSQAKAVGEKLKDYNFDVIYSSDLDRAIDTANYINEHHNQVIIFDELLRERGLGILEGKTWDIIKMNYKDAASIYHSEDTHSDIPGGGESKKRFANRVMTFMDKIAVQEEGKKVLIITHGGYIVYFINLVLGLALNKKSKIHYVRNGSISKFRYQKGEWFLEKFNV
ncbi:MAG: histidine phosphatase family protein [Clostridiales bacterium]|nr:histidine phosphatase family protein [Clostridiales bacterium]